MNYPNRAIAITVLIIGSAVTFSCKHNLNQPTRRFFSQDSPAWVELTYEGSKTPTMITGVIRTGKRWRYELLHSNGSYRVCMADGSQIMCSDGYLNPNIAVRLQMSVKTSLWEKVISEWTAGDSIRLPNFMQFEMYSNHCNQYITFNTDTGLLAQYGNDIAMESVVYVTLSEQMRSVMLTTNEMQPIFLWATTANAKRQQLIPGTIIHVSSKCKTGNVGTAFFNTE